MYVLGVVLRCVVHGSGRTDLPVHRYSRAGHALHVKVTHGGLGYWNGLR